MKFKKILIFSLLTFNAACLCFYIPQIKAETIEFPIAISKGIFNIFPEIRVVLSDLSTKSDGKFGYYEGSPVNVFESVQHLPFAQCKILITTSSELEKIPSNYISPYVIEKGRNLKVEFFLIGRQTMPLLNFVEPKLAHQPEDSFMNFYVDILLGCLYQNLSEERKPKDRIFLREDWKPDKLKDRDIIIIGYFPALDQRVGIELLHLIRQITNFPNIPIPYFNEKVEPGAKETILNCFEEISKKSSTMDLNYELESWMNLQHVVNVLGVNLNSLERQVGESWIVQAVTKKEMIVLIYPNEQKSVVREFWKLLYDQLMFMKYMHIKKPNNSESAFLGDAYKRAVYILTTGLRGLIEVANFDFETANNIYEEIDDIYGIPSIQNKLKEGIWLDEDTELKHINEAIEFFQKYFDRRNLPKKRVDFTLLKAKCKMSLLSYFVYQHYYNLSQGFKGESEDMENISKNSEKYLRLSQNTLRSLLDDIKIVREVDDFDYPSMRKTERFNNIVFQSENFKEILNI